MKITEKQYNNALSVIKKYHAQLLKYKKIKIVPDDIDLLSGGFECKKITKLSDEQLKQLERTLSEKIASCTYVNIEEYRYLTVAWHSKYLTTFKEVTTICKILNKIQK
jgi:hypothetical protein